MAATALVHESSPGQGVPGLDVLERVCRDVGVELQIRFKVSAVAKLLGVGAPTINRMILDGRLKAITISSHVRWIHRDELAAFLVRASGGAA